VNVNGLCNGTDSEVMITGNIFTEYPSTPRKFVLTPVADLVILTEYPGAAKGFAFAGGIPIIINGIAMIVMRIIPKIRIPRSRSTAFLRPNTLLSFSVRVAFLAESDCVIFLQLSSVHMP